MQASAASPPLSEPRRSARSCACCAVSQVSTPKDTASGGAEEAEQEPIQGLSEPDLALAGKIIQEFGGGYDVGHSAPFWIVDKKGMIHVGMDASATPADIVSNLRVLLRLK